MGNMDYLYSDLKCPNLDHPNSALRLACVVHRFRVPKITSKVSFVASFATVGRPDKTHRLLTAADDARNKLTESSSASQTSAERVLTDAKRYQPLIHSVLLSCKVQPDEARLDERLVFEWKSGVEEKPKSFNSEAMMYDFVMTIVSEGLGRALRATEHSVAGEFAAASRDYAAAAGVFHFLAEEHLPKWIARGSKADDDTLPSECQPEFAQACATLFLAHGQQMAVATLLMKEGTPNYGLLAKLCLGISEQLEEYLGLMRASAGAQMVRMDPDFFTLLALQISVQKALTVYFQGRAAWVEDKHGLAIALVSEATVALRQRSSAAAAGVPDVGNTPSLKPLLGDLKDLRDHMAVVLKTWEKDNNAVYFSAVPQHVPAGSKLTTGLCMKKMTEYALEEAEPALLVLPEGALTRSDSDLARELQQRFNLGKY